ncbi:cellulose binding domain-containing protein [Streptomyces sp. NPDC057616]|uniref:cellulose binding domain-containing protein n=1 Tax=Streptomyces sp. NPDC057616 TaxID=3346183 RepID=UPI0036A575FB
MHLGVASAGVTPASCTNTIPVGGSVTVGFIAGKGATNTAPAEFTLNGSTCTTTAHQPHCRSSRPSAGTIGESWWG